MWVYNNDYKKWEATGDKLLLTDYELLKQELSSVRFYSKCLSGATYLPVHTLENIYDILGEYKPRNWYLSTVASPYVNTGIPAEYAEPIFATTSYDYYTKYVGEYGLTLKNLFTPTRLIKDSIKNYIQVDLATDSSLDDLLVTNSTRIIDGVRLLNGHRVLVKDQRSRVTLPNTQDPDQYFLAPYTVVQNFGATIEYETASVENGIYIYRDGLLIREPDLDDYDDCRRFSVVVKNGVANFDRQFHLVRLLNGYYPTTSKNEPIQFSESKNWLLRNRVDYNNLFEINYYDVIKSSTQSYNIDGITYSIPERVIAIGEFGIILNTQEGISNIIFNKYKVNLRSISQTSKFYFICGDDGVLLKVRKHDFVIDRIILPTTNNLRSVSFFDDLKGVVVGDLNSVYVTENGGVSWNPIKISAFDPYYFTKVIYYSPTSFFISGNVGVFVEFKKDISGWSAYKRKISRFIDDDDEYLLVDNINDIYYTTLTTWGLSYSYFTQSIPVDKAMLFIVTDDSKLIVHDINSFTNFDFLYLDFPTKYGDIRNITRKFATNEFYFTGIEETTGDTGLFSFDLSNFVNLGVGNSYSNTIASTFSATYSSSLYGNEVIDYFGQNLIVAGNESLLKTSTYSTPLNFNVLDVNFENRLKSKLLFLDYDVGSKLNFFTDFGDYRLPETLNATISTTASHIGFSPILVGTQSEFNWIRYTQDRQMTFEYYTINPMQEATKVEISPDFYNSTYSVLDVLTVATSSYDILPLAPTILDPGHSRFNAIGLTAISSPPAYDLYLYDYLMIAKVPFEFSVNKGDILRLETNTVEGNFMVNKIATPPGLLPSTTDIFAIYDTTSMNISDAATASVQLKNWFANFCSTSPFYQGSLYILPSSTEQWLALPDLVYTGNLQITPASSSANWDQLSEIVSYTQSITNITGAGTLASRYFNATGITWSAPQNLILISFIDEADDSFGSLSIGNGYHGLTLSSGYNLGTYSQPFTRYITDYNKFVNLRSPLTGTQSFNYFKGVLYPIVRGGNAILHSVCASLVLQAVSAMYGKTMSQAEVDAIPGIATDISSGYLGTTFSFITNGINSGWTSGETRINVTPVIQNNPYSALTDPNGNSGLLQHGWIGFFDKRNIKRVGSLNVPFNPFNPAIFQSDLNSLVQPATGTDKFLYMFSEFNQNITTEIKNETTNPTFSIKLTNLNRYNDLDNFVDRFSFHPLSNGYSIDFVTNSNVISTYSLVVTPKFNNLTSYYNLATDVIIDSSIYQMQYTSGFLKFGYSPTYNLLDYLESINDLGDPNPKFYPSKEYYVMPDLRDVPMAGINSFTFSVAYVDYNGMTAAQGLTVSNRQDNKILFGRDLQYEWNSIFVNTFVDINLYATSSMTTTERALVTKKYVAFDAENGVDYYVIEFHKRLNYVVNSPLYKVDIISRKRLDQISDDLQQLNLIQRPVKSKEYLAGSGMNLWFADYTQFEREMNFKVNTDSYAKILLSDVDTIQSISAVLYTDYKNEYAMNVTRLGREVSVPILNTANFAGNLFISCSEKHGLKDEEGVVLEFFGGTGSSQTVNQQYFGYHPIKKVNEYNFYINFPYGNVPLVGNDTGIVKYYRQDPFLRYEPVDLIDVGVDKRGKIAIELTTENTIQVGATYSLSNVDFSKYRFRLVDGLNIETLAQNFPWIYEAEISGAVIGQSGENLIWYKGIWECGRWFGGIWQSGYWKSGDWYGGTWNSKLIKDNWINVEVDERSSGLSYSTWVNGRWYDGTWNNGTWANGRWYGGTWNDGVWYKGIWNDGTWNMGKFNGGIWVLGTWNGGIFNTDNEPSYWIDGHWYGGDFENGMWYSGVFDQKFSESRFGVNAYNSRTAIWHGGKWINGSFHSRLNVNDQGQYDVSDVHKYSIWYTGQWFSGDFYGGVAYNMNFKSGTWHGGILEDVQIIGLTGSSLTSENYFTTNGIFKFNIGDEIKIIDNQIGNTFSVYGSNLNPQSYTILYTVEDTLNKRTNVYVNRNISLSVAPPVDVGIRIVSDFYNCNWKSGIWTNGLFNTGLWEGGIWYGGVFGNNAVWM